jgi:hypothetical protein
MDKETKAHRGKVRFWSIDQDQILGWLTPLH